MFILHKSDVLVQIILLAKSCDPLYSSSPLASLDGFSGSHSDGLYVMQLVVAATNQNELYKKHMFCRKNVNKIKMKKFVRRNGGPEFFSDALCSVFFFYLLSYFCNDFI